MHTVHVVEGAAYPGHFPVTGREAATRPFTDGHVESRPAGAAHCKTERPSTPRNTTPGIESNLWPLDTSLALVRWLDDVRPPIGGSHPEDDVS